MRVNDCGENDDAGVYCGTIALYLRGFCVAIMAMKKELAAVLVLLLAPVTWFYCHKKIHFQIRNMKH